MRLASDFRNLDYLPFRAHPERDSDYLPFLETVPPMLESQETQPQLLYRRTSGLLQLFPNVRDVSPWERARCNTNSHAWWGARTRRLPGLGGKRCAGHFKLFFS